MCPNRTKVCLGFSVFAAGGRFRRVGARPTAPQDDAVVLEDAARPDRGTLRPRNCAGCAPPRRPRRPTPRQRARLARRYFDLAMAEGDPRYVGYAEAALRAWPETAATSGGNPGPARHAAPVPARLRARHGGLRPRTARGPRQLPRRAPGARRSGWCRPTMPAARARMRLARGTRDRAACDGLHRLRRRDDGHARAAYERLAAALARRGSVDPEFQRGSRPGSRKWPGASATRPRRSAISAPGLALGVDDNFLLAAYADFLLEQGRAAEVMALLKNWARSDTLLLRLALAAQDARPPGGRKVRAHAGRSLRGRRAARREAAPAGGSELSARPQGRRAGGACGGGRELPDAARAARCAGTDRSGARRARPGRGGAALQWLDATGFESVRTARRSGEAQGAPAMRILALLSLLCACGIAAGAQAQRQLSRRSASMARRVHGQWDIALRDLEFVTRPRRRRQRRDHLGRAEGEAYRNRGLRAFHA